MKDKKLYIIDIRFKQKNIDLSQYCKEKNIEFLSLTPYSSYLLDDCSKNYLTYHNIISEEDFKNQLLEDYSKLEELFINHQEYKFLMRNIAFILTFEKYLNYLFNFFDTKKVEGYSLVYITDSKNKQNEKLIDNNYSYIYNYNFSKTIFIDKIDKLFYKKNDLRNKFSFLLYKKNIFQKIYKKYIRVNSIQLNYDNSNFSNIYFSIKPIAIKNKLDKDYIKKITEKIEDSFIFSYTKQEYKVIKNEIESFFIDTDKKIVFKPFMFLSKYDDYRKVLLYKKNYILKVFMQHGSYFHENIFLKFNEIYPADINFVFNDYTKKLFEDRGAKEAYSVGSIDFNYKIKDKKIKYDFLYIVYCTSYSYTGTIIGSKENLLSVDAKNIYQRHKSVIELFGTRLKEKRICIKMQPNIMIGSMLYIPFLELSKSFKNITIEFSTPIGEIIFNSKYIISDYFSSDFINRELHYKRDIILFNSSIVSLPKETIEDMKKMFILVDSVDDLAEKIEILEKITKNRKRYDDIIEYYSSKKCDTKKNVTEILKRELDGR